MCRSTQLHVAYQIRAYGQTATGSTLALKINVITRTSSDVITTWNGVEDDAADDDEEKRYEELDDGDDFVAQRVDESFDEHGVELLAVEAQPAVARELDAERCRREQGVH